MSIEEGRAAADQVIGIAQEGIAKQQRYDEALIRVSSLATRIITLATELQAELLSASDDFDENTLAGFYSQDDNFQLAFDELDSSTSPEITLALGAFSTSEDRAKAARHRVGTLAVEDNPVADLFEQLTGTSAAAEKVRDTALSQATRDDSAAAISESREGIRIIETYRDRIVGSS